VVKTAERFLTHVWKLHGLPLETVSDRGRPFNNAFMKALYTRLGINPRFSTAYHPQTDGQTERVNQHIEQYLRLFVNHRQSNWASLLPLAEFTYNNSVNTSTGRTPFYANYGYHPGFSSVAEPSNNADAEERAQEIQRVQEDLKEALKLAQEVHQWNYDCYRRQQPQLQVGDRVWLEATNITTTRSSAKLDFR
jgi:hypothetical protein